MISSAQLDGMLIVLNKDPPPPSGSLSYGKQPIKTRVDQLVQRIMLKEKGIKLELVASCIDTIPGAKEYTFFGDYHNAFVEAISQSYFKHIPLKLSPDIIWLAIVQGFISYLHAGQNSEKYRKQFVSFEEKKDICITRQDFIWGNPKNDWEGALSDFSKAIHQEIGDKNIKLLVPKFSTTTKSQLAVYHATLMDAMKMYFRYVLRGGSQIPSVRLTGTLEDWQNIIDRVQEMKERFDLGWWTDNLLPVLQKIKDAYKGEVDNEFWQCTVKAIGQNSSGDIQTLTGWILNFFPIINTDKVNSYLRPWEQILKEYRQLNHLKQNGKMQEFQQFREETSTSLFSFPKSLGNVELKFQDLLTKKKHDLLIIEGFYGPALNDRQEIEPVIGWVVVEKKKHQMKTKPSMTKKR